MTKEYHVFTEIRDNQEHAFIFEIERDDHYLDAKELWIVNVVNGIESHIRINLQQLFEKMANNVGGNVEDSSITTIMSILDDVLDTQKQLEVSIALAQKNVQQHSEADQLIIASDVCAGLSDNSLQEMLKNLKS